MVSSENPSFLTRENDYHCPRQTTFGCHSGRRSLARCGCQELFNEGHSNEVWASNNTTQNYLLNFRIWITGTSFWDTGRLVAFRGLRSENRGTNDAHQILNGYHHLSVLLKGCLQNPTLKNWLGWSLQQSVPLKLLRPSQDNFCSSRFQRVVFWKGKNELPKPIIISFASSTVSLQRMRWNTLGASGAMPASVHFLYNAQNLTWSDANTIRQGYKLHAGKAFFFTRKPEQT